MQIYCLLFWLLGCQYFACAQTSVVQDTKGETGLAMGSAGVVALNAKDESISFSYGIPINKPVKGTHPFRHYAGASAKAKGKSGLAPLFKGEDFQYDGNIGIFYFLDKTSEEGRIWQINLSADLLFNQFKLYDSSSVISFADRVYDENQSGYKLAFGGSYYSAQRFLAGMSLNGGGKNNTSDLKTLDVSDFYTVIDPGTGLTRIVQSKKSSAYDINEYRAKVEYFNLNADIGWRVFKQMLSIVHLRWSVQEFRKPQFNPGAGIYFSKSKSPTEIVAGFQVQWLDWANTGDSEKKRSERMSINVVAGFTF